MKRINDVDREAIFIGWIIVCIALGALTTPAAGWLVFGLGIVAGVLLKSQIDGDDK